MVVMAELDPEARKVPREETEDRASPVPPEPQEVSG